MAKGPLAASHRAAQASIRDLGKIFNSLGNTDHPNGSVLVAYRNALRSIGSSLTSNGDRRSLSQIQGVNEALGELRTSLSVTSGEAVARATGVGEKSAARQLKAYDVPVTLEEIAAGNVPADAVRAIMSEYDRQAEIITALVISGMAPEQIIGDANRQGALRPAPFLQNASNWISLVAGAVMQNTAKVSGQATGQEFKKQAVAAHDGRTTETCLRVMGQTQELDDPFRLTGTPRYADRIDWSPFHWWCRTSIVLYQEAADFDLTSELRGKAKRELDRRFAATGSYKPTAKSPTSGLIKRKARKRVFSAASINRRLLSEPTLQARGAVIEAELKIFNSRTIHLKETAYAIDAKTGKQILRKTGGKSAVSFTEKEAARMRNSIVTHNHPSGASFSIEDVVFSHDNELAEMRAISLDRTYILEPPEGLDFFVHDNKMLSELMMDYSDWYLDMATKWEAGVIAQADWADEGRKFWQNYTEKTGAFRYTEVTY